MSHMRRQQAPSSDRSSESGQNSGDLYHQLIASNDLVRELDDIEAISQQISEHAEVLYQSWKSSSTDNNDAECSGRESEHDGYISSSSQVSRVRPYRKLDHRDVTCKKCDKSQPLSSTLKGNIKISKSHQVDDLLQPVANNCEQSKVEPLQLLASPEVNGNLKNLVSNFVSTDKAKQAARQTISDTISCMTKRNNGILLKSDGPSSIEMTQSKSLAIPTFAIHSAFSSLRSEEAFPGFVSSGESLIGRNDSIHTKLSPIFDTRSVINRGDLISIPVQHETHSLLESGLKSPKMLQNISDKSSNKSNPQFSLPSLHAASVERMKARFDEAKQRINMMHQRAMDFSGIYCEQEFPKNDLSTVDANVISIQSRLPMDCDNDQYPTYILEQLRRSMRRRETPAAPHPVLTPHQKQHIYERRATTNSQQYNLPGFPTRRFLSGGSVAERVLIFERCPIFNTELKRDKSSLEENESMKPGRDTNEAYNHLNTASGLTRRNPYGLTGTFRTIPISETSNVEALIANSSSPGKSKNMTVLQNSIKTVREANNSRNQHEVIPEFYFLSQPNKTWSEKVLAQLVQNFQTFRKLHINQDELGQLLKTSGYLKSWKSLVYSIAQGDKSYGISIDQITKLWSEMLKENIDEASQFVYLLTKGARKFAVPEDFVTLIQDIVEYHPGLGFLKDATEFHSRYVHTVIARIFFAVNRSWSGRISLAELRKSNLIQVMKLLEEEDDINQITDYFSYEHFYVIYCKFWELDTDHDLFIDREDLSKHNDHAISTRMIDRIFSGAVTRGAAQKDGKMTYTEFVWFLIAEEDKRHPTSIEYWFRCMDLDGDGFLSMYELEYFYEEQLQRMEQLGIETLPFEDCLCQMLDMIMPKDGIRITLHDLKNCSMTSIFFDTFFNLEKYLDHEQRDPFASKRELYDDGTEMSDWDRFAAEEYELLVVEEGTPELLESCYETDLLACTEKEEAFTDDCNDSTSDISQVNIKSKI